ncbi:putative aldouronate transport system permease protein [Paenibacillus sp. BK033]|uniref:ABC transporter permease subunit n=1 Tax=Paenibacillus sp. BK033 TaxID=2512133 RepID=UPI00104DDD84|nr:ABC transporter permease subunit [Paenibacillus sp. BK033]TCN00573.1 putative aldouronate transport system permease protein [Paenibacillus sp. BK033]
MRLLKKYSALYVMMVPVIAYFLVFAYYPLVKGLQTSFQDYKLMGDRPYVGFENYSAVLHDSLFWEAVVNTLVIGGGILCFSFAAPLAIALSLNEVLRTWFKKAAQMILYVPHLLSWVVVGGIWIFMLSPDSGIINMILVHVFHMKPINFMADSGWARWILILLATWKEMGYTCILFLAGIVSINPSLYEAARMDGATRWKQLIYVTIPQLSNTMKVVFLLNTLGILRIFDEVFILRNPTIAAKVDVLMMYTFQKGILEIQLGPAAAASFFVLLLTLAMTLVVRRITRFDEV